VGGRRGVLNPGGWVGGKMVMIKSLCELGMTADVLLLRKLTILLPGFVGRTIEWQRCCCTT